MEFFSRLRKLFDPKVAGAIAFAACLLFSLGKSKLFSADNNIDIVTFSRFIRDLHDKCITSAEITSNSVQYITNGNEKAKKTSLMPNHNLENLIRDLSLSNADVSIKDATTDSFLSSALLIVLPLSYLAILYFMLKSLTKPRIRFHLRLQTLS